jgi:hypothetical protein
VGRLETVSKESVAAAAAVLAASLFSERCCPFPAPRLSWLELVGPHRLRRLVILERNQRLDHFILCLRELTVLDAGAGLAAGSMVRRATLASAVHSLAGWKLMRGPEGMGQALERQRLVVAITDQEPPVAQLLLLLGLPVAVEGQAQQCLVLAELADRIATDLLLLLLAMGLAVVAVGQKQQQTR